MAKSRKKDPVAKNMHVFHRATTFAMKKNRIKAGYIKHKKGYQGDAKGATSISLFNIILNLM